MGRKVGMAILVIWDLVFPKAARISSKWDWDMSWKKERKKGGKMLTPRTTPLHPEQRVKPRQGRVRDGVQLSDPRT